MTRFAATVSLAALALAGCATTPPAMTSADAPAMTAGDAPEMPAAAATSFPLTTEGARAFVAAAEADLFEYSTIASRASWVNATYLTDDTDALNAYFGTIGTEKGLDMRPRRRVMPPSPGSISTSRASSTSCAAR